MQLILPLFPFDTKMISGLLGVREVDQMVHYIANGLPVFSHGVEDIQSFRFVTSNFIHQGLCGQSDIARSFNIPIGSVKRNLKKFREEGEAAFFSEDKRRGHSHKIRGSVLERIQKKLDKGQSTNSIAKEEKLTEGSIRYRIIIGDLKKKVLH